MVSLHEEVEEVWIGMRGVRGEEESDTEEEAQTGAQEGTDNDQGPVDILHGLVAFRHSRANSITSLSLASN